MYNKKKVALLIVILLLILGGIGFVVKKLVFSGTGNGKGPAIKIEEQQKKKKPKKEKKEKTQENSEENSTEDNDNMEIDMTELNNSKNAQTSSEDKENSEEENEDELKDPASSVTNLSESKDRDRLTDLVETIFTNNVKEYWKGKYEGSYEESTGTDGKANFTFYLYCSDKETEYLNSLMADTGSFNKYWNKELQNFKNFTNYMNKYYLINASLKVKTPDGSANMVEAENGKVIYDFAETLNRKPKEKEPVDETDNQAVDIEGLEIEQDTQAQEASI